MEYTSSRGNELSRKGYTGLAVQDALDTKKSLVIAITRVAVISGNKLTPEAIAIMAEETFRILSTRYPKLPITEVPEILRSGAIGDYGDNTFLCVANINSWLKRAWNDILKKEDLKQKKEEEIHKMPMQARAGFFMKNLDKLPSLKSYLNGDTENTTNGSM